MNNEILKLGITFVMISVFSTQGISQTEKSDQNFQAVTLENTEQRYLHSSIVGQDYELVISLPKSYHKNDKVYPTIFLLDPYRAFSIIKGYTDVLTSPHSIIPEIIIVGIGYGGKGNEALLKWALGRTRDLTPVKDSVTEAGLKERIAGFGIPDVEVHTGGAEVFLEFIETELFPFIESNYRIDKKERMLCGYSYGGLFGLYTLFHNPDLFSGYLIGSPSINYKVGIITSYESDYARKQTDIYANVFMSAGELEETTSIEVKKLEELLRSRNYENLELNTDIFEDEGHVTCMTAALGRGIPWLLNKEENH